MFELTHFNYATIILDVGAVLLVCGILRQTRFMRRSGRESDRLFFGMLLWTIVIAVSDMVDYLAEDRPTPFLMNLQLFAVTIFFMACTVFAMSWFDYCTYRFKDGEEIKKIGLKPEFIPGVLIIGLFFVNQTTGYIFFIDELGGFQPGLLYAPVTFALLAYLIPGFFYIAKYRKADQRVLIPVWIYAMPIVVSVVTYVLGDISIIAMGCAVTITFTHLGTMEEIAESSMKESVM